jgi:hypothetical protein
MALQHATHESPSGDPPSLLSQEQIYALTMRERRELARRLLGLSPVIQLPERDARRRRRTLLVLTVSCVVLVPWVIFLALSLPRHYETGNWRATWVGFDISLILALALTAYLGWRRRQLVMFASFATGLLLVCDAWFDVSTAGAGTDRWTAIASAVFLELPLAALLLSVTYRLLRLVAARRLGGSSPHTLWTLPALMQDDSDEYLEAHCRP